MEITASIAFYSRMRILKVTTLGSFLTYIIIAMAIYLAILSSMIHAAHPQQATQNLTFQTVGIEDGLPDNNILEIIQDDMGFVWLASEHGLSRYDGLAFEKYNYNLNEADSISNNNVLTVFQDTKGIIWAGTDFGLNQLDSRQTGFTHFFHQDSNNKSLTDNTITAINQDSAGNLWIGTANGLNKQSRDSKNEYSRYLISEGENEPATVINTIQSYNNILLVGTNKGLYSYVPSLDSFVKINANLPNTTRELNILALFVDSRETLWLSTEQHGLFNAKTQDSQIKEFNQIKKISDVMSINEDVNGNIWIGTLNQGIYIYYIKTDNFVSVTSVINSQSLNFHSTPISSLMVDNSGLLWFSSTGSGIYQWSPNTLNIMHISANSLNSADNTLGQYVWSIKEDSTGILWITTRDGVRTYNPQTNTINFINLNENGEHNQPEVFTISMEDEHFWFTTENSILRYTPGIGITKRISSSQNSDIQLPENLIVYDAEYLSGKLYVAIENHNLLALDIANNEVREIAIKGENEGDPTSVRPIDLKKANDNSLWLLTKDGLYNYSPDEDRFRLAIDAGIHKLSNNRVSALYEESPTSLWLGTSGNGVNHVNYDLGSGTYQVEQFNHIDVLRNQIVNGLLLDDDIPANLWISTHSGLFNFNTVSYAVRQFTGGDGIQGREFNEGSYFRDLDGYLYFGGTNGINRLDPIELSTSSYEPPLRITNVQIDCPTDQYPCNETISAVDVNYLCMANGNNCLKGQLDNFHLPADVNKIQVSFIALDFTNPKRNKYRYRLFSEESVPWTELNNETLLVFTQLESNQYTLEIQGSNHAGVWGKQITRFEFVIDTPWYKSNFSYVVFFIIIILTIYLYISNRRIKRQEEKLVQVAIDKSEENFKFALWGSGDELWEWEVATDKLIRTNPIEVIDDEEHLNGHMSDVLTLIHPEDRKEVETSLKEHLQGIIPHFESFFRIQSKGGGYIWTLARARVVEKDADGKPTRLLGSIKDITLIKATEDKLTLIAKAFDNTMDGISILDPSFSSVLNNQAFYKITGLSVSEAINNQYFFAENSLNHSQFHQLQVTLRNFGEWEGEIWERHPNGEKFALDLKIDTVLDSNSQVSHYICIFSDITYRKKADKELRKLANQDSLTGLPNRSLFMDRLSQALAFAKRNDTQFALLFIDLDHFKNINDSLGHSVGDELLKKVARRLSRCVRDSDTVARLGGDEFTIILENIKNTDEVGVCANKIIKRMEKSIVISGTILITSPSIGIGMYPSDGNNIETLLKNADLAMYSAKEKGRNNYQFFTSDMTSSAIERINIENKLRDAIEKQQLHLYYQPKVYTINGKLTGFEALIRWIHPEEGIISPAAFIPVAEETGLILSMGDWILEEAIQQAKSWSEINAECCAIAINISARQFQQGGLAKKISRLLDKYQLDPKYIELEITEGTLMFNMEHAISTLEKLSNMGISLSLDDFGTGYSSLSYLKRFPVNKLKVDQSFVRDITIDPGDASIVASIISLAHNLGLTVVAEGCETLEQLTFISSYDCEEVQGYLFSRPLPKDEAEQILNRGQIIIDRG